MNIEKVNELMNEVAEKLSRECKMNGANAEKILLLAKAINELAVVRTYLAKISAQV